MRREALCHNYGYSEGVKTTIDIPDDLFRLAKARAALDGVSLRQLVTDTLRSHLERESQQIRPADPPWMKGFGELADLREETARLQDVIREEFERIEPEPDA